MKSFSAFLLVLLLPISAFCRNIYVLYDANCMDRLVYTYQAEGGQGEYVVYHINLSATEKIILEVGSENTDLQDYIPNNIWRCDNANFNLAFIQSINQNADQVFLVLKKGAKQYQISSVKFAAHYKLDGEIVQYFSPKYRFEFDLRAGTIGENIAFEDPRSEVYFEGRLDNVCSGAFIFRQYSENRNSPPHTDMVLVPEIGIIEERSGKNVEDAFSNALHLSNINGVNFDKYLNRLCGIVDENETEESNEEVTEFEAPDLDTPVKDVFVERSVETGEPSANQHVIRKGDTLYKIAQKYKVSVAQIQAWNDMGNSTAIYPGTALWVGLPLNKEKDGIIAEAEKGGDSNPVPYDEMSDPIFGNRVLKKDDTPYHEVKPGETVAYIAQKYGYTESKFREINELGPNQFVRIGQRLKTSDCNCPENPGNEDVSNKGIVEYNNTDFDNAAPGVRFNYVNPNKKSSDTPVNRNIPTFYDAPNSNYYTNESNNQGAYFEPTNEVQSYENTGQNFNFAPNSRKVHVVQDGESIYSIARKYSITVEKLRDLNNLEKNEVVIPFQKIYVE